MVRLSIDNREVEVSAGCTILDAAQKLGIEIPTMCFLKGFAPSTSCMVCVVKVEGADGLLPACTALAQEGMRVFSNCEEVIEARKCAIELLLSEHVGDCTGPCQRACPAGMNIPLMIRQIGAGKVRAAIETVKRDIALPAVLGRICPAPCGKACRRGQVDEGVSICLLKRYAADVDLAQESCYQPPCGPKQDKRVAIVGGGPAGLAAAYYLLQQGYPCTIFDKNERMGGMLRDGVGSERLSEDVLDAEIAAIEKLGLEFRGKMKVGGSVSLDELRRDFDAVFVGVGEVEGEEEVLAGLEMGTKGIKIESSTYETSLSGVFAGGDAVRRRRLAVRAVADGKEAAIAMAQYLAGQKVTGAAKHFNSQIGRIKDEERERFLSLASKAGRVLPASVGAGFTAEQARAEAGRCLHCDCRKPDTCKLRKCAEQFGARARVYKNERQLFEAKYEHPEVVFEPGKCIDCGLCVQITAREKERLGLSFVGRGFDVRVAVPFGRSIAEGLERTAHECVEACPTGALAYKDEA